MVDNRWREAIESMIIQPSTAWSCPWVTIT